MYRKRTKGRAKHFYAGKNFWLSENVRRMVSLTGPSVFAIKSLISFCDFVQTFIEFTRII